ncbi:MAG: homoserine O-acetyltransferase/O-succinyltransferase family protein [Pseudohongiellaceae bacterium]
MPIKLPNTLPAFAVLKREGVMVMGADVADKQDIRPLRIGLLNLMPKKIQTETQFARLIGATPLQVELSLIRMTDHETRNTAAAHMEEFYRPFAEVAASGALRASLDVFEVEDGNGNIFAIMDDGRSWQEIQERRPDRKLVTRREAAIALAFYQRHALGIMTEEVKANFPKAEVIAVNDNLNDEIKL